MRLVEPSRCQSTGKVRYPTRKLARGAKRRLRGIRKFRDLVHQVYRCEACAGFHLSTMPRDEYREMIARTTRKTKRKGNDEHGEQDLEGMA